MGPNPKQGGCGRSPGGYTMTSIPCVLNFLQTRGKEFKGTGTETIHTKAPSGYLLSINYLSVERLNQVLELTDPYGCENNL